MSTPRLTARVPSARAVCSARLENHRLIFHKKGRDGSAKCDVEESAGGESCVYGVVYRILAVEKALLDAHEGLGRGYAEKSVTLSSRTVNSFSAVTYFATHIDASLKPYHWYKEHVFRGAREHDLPPEYVQAIQAVDSIPDPDELKQQAELAIYR